jgi:hypothetical protein
MSETYDGPERRETERRGCTMPCDDHVHRVVHEKLEGCKADMYKDIHLLRADMSNASKKIDALASDVHRLNVSVADIAINSKSIASSLQTLTEVKEAYETFKGFARVLNWMRQNVVTVALIVAIVMFAMGKLDLKSLIGWVL